MQKIKKHLIAFAMILLIVVPAFALTLEAGAQSLNTGIEYGENTGLGNRDPRDIAASVVNVILGFLGIVALVIILIGGFQWMTAGGNDDKVTEATNRIKAGAIGLVIVLAAYGIASYVINAAIDVTGTP